jgi:pyruvate/2-oxoglutarate dehydrogenase complex dihydrolipoamide acyltransferase (E2) component
MIDNDALIDVLVKDVQGATPQRACSPDRDGGVPFQQELPLDLSFAHRVVDGIDAARFLGTLADNIETAEEFV